MKVKIEAGIEDVFAQQAVFLGLLDGDFQAVDRNRILRAHINIAFRRADGITADCHSFHDTVRIAFQRGAIHKCAGVALVRVADDIFLIRLVHGGQLPLAAGWEAAAAAAAQPGILNHLNDLLRRVFCQALCKRLIAVVGDVFIDILRVDHAAVTQRHALLLFIEIS